jgi:YfiH family protein
VYYKDSFQIYRVLPLDSLGWLTHGFGTRASADAGKDGNLATLRQVHSNRAILAGGQSGCLGEGDALLEDTPGRLVAVKTADCLPVLLVDERHRAVAAVHAGWRGTAQHIVMAAVEEARRAFGTRPDDVHAAIGPGIGPCCYEVGPDVAGRFGIRAESPVHLDLGAENRRQLLASGVRADRIYSANLCTMCEAADFHSYRRDKEQAGRMYSFAGIR